MNDLATLCARPTPITLLDGSVREFFPLTWADWGDVQRWIERQIPDPFAVAQAQIAAGGWSKAQQEHLMACAMREACKPKPRLFTAEADVLMNTTDGMAYIYFVSMRKGNPKITEKEAHGVFELMGPAQHIQAATATTAALAVLKGESPDPKALSTASPESTGG